MLVGLSLLAGTSQGGAVPGTGTAASVTAADLGVLAHALVFQEPPVPDKGVIAIAYAAGDPASQRDAAAILAEIGSGLATANGTLRPVLVDTATLASSRFQVLIPAAGAAGPALKRAWQKQHALCVTTDLASVRNGSCIIGIRTAPRVNIILNGEAARQAGIRFATAFLMMINEL